MLSQLLPIVPYTRVSASFPLQAHTPKSAGQALRYSMFPLLSFDTPQTHIVCRDPHTIVVTVDQSAFVVAACACGWLCGFMSRDDVSSVNRCTNICVHDVAAAYLCSHISCSRVDSQAPSCQLLRSYYTCCHHPSW